MKYSLFQLVSIVVLLGCWTAHYVDASGPSVEKEIAALDDQVISAYFKGDTATLRRVEAEDFIGIGDEGKAFSTTDRYESIEREVKKGRWFPGGATRTNETRTIRVFGPTAIVHGISIVKTPDSQERVAFSGVWHQRKGAWRLVHLHFHTLKSP